METGANKGQAGFILTALDGKQDLPPGDHPLWIFDEGNAVRLRLMARDGKGWQGMARDGKGCA